MTYLQFQDTFSYLPVISIKEIKKRFSSFSPNTLTRWQKKGYIEKIRNGYYRLSQQVITSESDLFFISNQIYHPSYVSLQSAFRWYDFIPEGVFTITSVSSRKTQVFNTSSGVFSYKNVKKELFFGYKLEEVGGYRFKIAVPEKAILDFLYLFPTYESEDDFFELRLNIHEIKEQIKWEVIEEYLTIFNTKSLEKRVNSFKKFIVDYDVIS